MLREFKRERERYVLYPFFGGRKLFRIEFLNMDERLVERLELYVYMSISCYHFYLWIRIWIESFFFFFSFHINAIVWEKMENVKLD